MFIFLQPKIQNNTSRRVVYEYYRDTALQFTTYDSIKEYNVVSYKGVRSPHAEDKCSWGFARVHCCVQDILNRCHK